MLHALLQVWRRSQYHPAKKNYFCKVLSQKGIIYKSLEPSPCTSIVSYDGRAFTGQSDGTIRVRDLIAFSIIETYLGHVDYVESLCFDESFNLYSASYDGSIKKWNMAARRVAFSFENRKYSVTAIAISNNQLLVGLRGGMIALYNTKNAFFVRSLEMHSDSITSILADDDFVYSAGLDGLISKISASKSMSSTILFKSSGKLIKSLVLDDKYFIAIQEETKILLIPRNEASNTSKIVDVHTSIVCVAATEDEILAGSRSGTIYSWSVSSLEMSFELKAHLGQVNHLLVVQNFLFSASNDKTIMEWDLDKRSINRVYKRTSATALGHLGTVNSVSYCYGTLFSAGADLSVRRWSVQTGEHEDVYFGFSKPVTAVLCHNRSVYAGSEDFSVLMFTPELPQQDNVIVYSSSISKAISSKRGKRIIRSEDLERTTSISLHLTVSVVLPLLVLSSSIALLIFYKRSKAKLTKPSAVRQQELSVTEVTTDLETVINTVIGISKHASFLIDNAYLAKIKKLTAGGGGEIFLAKIMDSGLRKRMEEMVIQKIVFAKNKASEEAFYQEVGVMIMLSTYPNFCKIYGYTEKPLSLVLQYYPAGSLNEWLRNNRFNANIMLKILREVSGALKTMHSHYLAHCDLKPQNILVQLDRNVPSCFLTDFGITQVLSEKIIATKAFNVINLRGLSVHYAAPEAFVNFRSKRYNGADFKMYDIFSVACVVYELQTKSIPWD